MSVLENLKAGAYLIADKTEVEKSLRQVFDLFPVLENRISQVSGTLSGGEQQMLAIGRALMSRPRLLCIDEPSTGLAPLTRKEVFNQINAVREIGITVLLIEQEVNTVFDMADRNYVLSSGKIVAEGTGPELMANELLRKTYLGL
jgi:branched-chain amino acid transport system ATP-binding protein